MRLASVALVTAICYGGKEESYGMEKRKRGEGKVEGEEEGRGGGKSNRKQWRKVERSPAFYQVFSLYFQGELELPV